ncbi:MAG: winged helix DNA-binding domain-containing protein [Acidobacteriota bacterium]
MTDFDSIALRRLHSHLLADNARDAPRDVVAHFGAVQAQDYFGMLWALGARSRHAAESDVERAIIERRIVRCWPMRGTLHVVAAEDVRWMLELLAPRVLARRARIERYYELDGKMLRRGRAFVERALRGGRTLTRAELYAALEKGGVATGAGRGLHVVFALAHERVICFGPRQGKQPTFVLFDEWVPTSRPKTRDEALAELARRYFRSHAPAGVADFVWWSGLTVKDAKDAIALSGASLDGEGAAATPSVHLLPPFDEYTVAYKDRTAILDPAFAKRLNAGGGMLNAVVVVNGRVAGNWKRSIVGDSVAVTVSPFHPLTKREARAVEREAARYAAFLGLSYLRTR